MPACVLYVNRNGLPGLRQKTDGPAINAEGIGFATVKHLEYGGAQHEMYVRGVD